MFKNRQNPTSPALQDGDYYMNAQGMMVFTEQYHKRRGYCCKNGCRHCPWKERKEINK